MISKIKALLRRRNVDAIELEYRINHGMKVGKNSHILSPEKIDGGWPWLISIGDNVTISTNVTILAHDASSNVVGCGTKLGRVDIGNNCFIGTGTIILCNIHIGDNVIVGAGSVVSKSLPSDGVYAGVPARKICTIDEYKTKLKELKETRPNFDHIHAWNEWREASSEEKDIMIESLKDGIGFI